MAYNTVIQQGYFTSDGLDKIIPLRSDVDWVEVHNLTNIAAGTQWAGVKWYWQRGLANDDSILSFHSTASQIISLSTSVIGFNGAVYRGISLIDSTDKTPGAAVVITAGTNATRPVYNTANTGILVEGSIVRITSATHPNLNGLDFTVDAVTLNTNFRLRNTLATAPGVASGVGTWRYVAPNETVYNMFNPKSRVISNITQAAAGVVTTLVNHTYQTGQLVRMKVPAGCGMTELNDQLVTITRLGDATFSVNVDTTGYTPFAFPLPAAVPFTPAEVVPVGESPTYNYLTDGAQENTGFIGIILGTSDTAGIALASPGGTAGDAIKWRAGKSFANIVG